MLFYSLVLWLYLLVCAAVFAVIVKVIRSSWGKRFRAVRWTLYLVLGGWLAFGLYTVLQPSRAAPDFPFLTKTSEAAELPGTYVLDAEATAKAAADPRQEGYRDLYAMLQLKADGTFEATHFPNLSSLWFETPNTPGYDDFTGVWNHHETSLLLYNFKFSEVSSPRPRQVNDLHVQLLDKTKGRSSYALGFLLNNGDEGYLIFVRK